MPASRVWMSATRNPRKGTTLKIGAAASRVQASTASRRTANGMILTVATMSLGLTTASPGKVASVIVSSTRLKRSTEAASTTQRPATSAWKLARPVKARPRLTWSPASDRATASAASFSAMSPGSSRAATTLVRPEAASAATSSAERTRPFLKVRSASLRLCARMAPAASSSGVSPNFTPPPPCRRAARRGARASPGRGSRPRSPTATPRRYRARPGRGCGRNRLSANPSSPSRCKRLAWVRFEPRAPM